LQIIPLEEFTSSDKGIKQLK